MREFLVIALLCACGGKKDSGGDVAGKPIAQLEDRSTPVWLGASAGKLLVLVERGDLGRKLVEIDPSAGKLRDIAATLPGGDVATHGGTLYVGDFKGEVSKIDPATGATTPIAKVGHTFTSFAATDRGVLLGGENKITRVDANGTETPIDGAAIGPEHASVDQLVANDLGAFAAASSGDAIVRIDGDRAVVIATGQKQPRSLAPSTTGVAWIGENGQKVLSVSPAGGAVKTLMKVPDQANAQACAAGAATIVCSVIRPNGGDLYVVSGDSPRRLVTARASMLVVDGSTVYWIEESDGKWLVKSSAL